MACNKINKQKLYSLFLNVITDDEAIIQLWNEKLN